MQAEDDLALAHGRQASGHEEGAGIRAARGFEPGADPGVTGGHQPHLPVARLVPLGFVNPPDEGLAADHGHAPFDARVFRQGDGDAVEFASAALDNFPVHPPAPGQEAAAPGLRRAQDRIQEGVAPQDFLFQRNRGGGAGAHAVAGEPGGRCGQLTQKPRGQQQAVEQGLRRRIGPQGEEAQAQQEEQVERARPGQAHGRIPGQGAGLQRRSTTTAIRHLSLPIDAGATGVNRVTGVTGVTGPSILFVRGQHLGEDVELLQENARTAGHRRQGIVGYPGGNAQGGGNGFVNAVEQ